MSMSTVIIIWTRTAGKSKDTVQRDFREQIKLKQNEDIEK